MGTGDGTVPVPPPPAPPAARTAARAAAPRAASPAARAASPADDGVPPLPLRLPVPLGCTPRCRHLSEAAVIREAGRGAVGLALSSLLEVLPRFIRFPTVLPARMLDGCLAHL